MRVVVLLIEEREFHAIIISHVCYMLALWTVMWPVFSMRGCSSVVERTLRMCEAPGSIPGISTSLLFMSCVFVALLVLHAITLPPSAFVCIFLTLVILILTQFVDSVYTDYDCRGMSGRLHGTRSLCEDWRRVFVFLWGWLERLSLWCTIWTGM